MLWLTVGCRAVLRCCPSADGDETSEIIIQTNFMLNLTVEGCGWRGGVQTTIVEVSCQQAAIAITTTAEAAAEAATQREHVHCAFRSSSSSGTNWLAKEG